MTYEDSSHPSPNYQRFLRRLDVKKSNVIAADLKKKNKRSTTYFLLQKMKRRIYQIEFNIEGKISFLRFSLIMFFLHLIASVGAFICSIELSFYFFYNIIFFYLFFFIRRKITRMTLIISVIYILTWIPNSVIFLLLRFTDHVTPNSPVDELGILLVTFNSCVNPIVYTLHSTPFRQRIRSMLLCKPRFSRNAIAPVAYATTPQRVEQDVDVTSYDNEDFVENGIECGSQLERSRQSVSNESSSSCGHN